MRRRLYTPRPRPAFPPLCATVGLADGEITSANIVGYDQATLRDVNEIAGAAFIPVTGNTIDIMDLQGAGYDPYDPLTEEGGATGQINLQTLTNYGETEKTYFWNDFSYEDEDSGETVVVKGWLDLQDAPAVRGDCVLERGAGFLLKCDGDGFYLKSSGEVLTSADCPVTLRDVNKNVANPTPVTIDLKDCYVTGYDPYDPQTEEGGATGQVNAQLVTSYGETAKTYFWNDFSYEDEDSGETVVVYGWLDLQDAPIVTGDCKVAKGLGFLMKCDGDGFSFVWPKVEVK